MANSRLRTAMTKCGATVEAVARDTEVSPKTVQRWLSGRLPHPRHRHAVAHLLGEDEEFLWPEAAIQQAAGIGGAAEIVAAYPRRAHVDVGRWWRLIEGAERQIDLLGFTLYFLPQQHPELIDVLLSKCQAGCQLRIVIADPESDSVRSRDEEEGEPITLVARIQTSLKAFEPLLSCESADMRFQDAPLYNSIFRFDDEMFVTPHLYATPGNAAPLLHLRRLGPSGLFSRFAAHFEGLWADTRPLRQDRPQQAVRSGE
ncbi:MAG TPA: XRE family transcriptional regulator [Nocardioidaceae bacterium]|nr:XRE family transcriptional regulator [Nocardioidaceae bacterium]